MADIIAMDETVFRDVYVANEDELWEADDFKSNQDKVQNDIYILVFSRQRQLLNTYYVPI